MPSRDEELGPLIRSAFLPEEGDEAWATVDCSQQEFRGVVHEAAIRNLAGASEAVERYCTDPDTDFHLLASDITGLPRKDAKAVNFAKIYGAGVKKFAEMIGRPLDEAQAIYAQYDDKLPFICATRQGRPGRGQPRRLHRAVRRRAAALGSMGAPVCVCQGGRTLLAGRGQGAHPRPRAPLVSGRARPLQCLHGSERADPGKRRPPHKAWMRRCWREGIAPSLQMHDGLELSVTAPEQAERVAKLACDAVALRVPMRADIKYGRNWGDAQHASWQELQARPRVAVPPLVFEAVTLAAAAERHICVHCRLDPPDGSEVRSPYNDAWLHPHCPDAFIRTRMAEENIAWGAVVSPSPREPEMSSQQDDAPAALAARQSNGNIDTHSVWVTFFTDTRAQACDGDEFTLPELAEGITAMTKASKAKLPLLKLARFGDKRSDKNCLRSNENVESVSGIEVEHDAGEIAFEAAVAIVRNAGLRALAYTSPSWQAGVKEKWRILLPLAQEHAPASRAELVARVNGLFDGRLTDESFVLSQPFYFGHLDGRAHREEVIDGDFLDHRDDLGAGAVGKSTGERKRSSNGNGAFSERDRTTPARTDDEIMELLEKSQIINPDGSGNWHNSVRDATASMIGLGWSDDEIYDATEPYCEQGWGDADVAELIAGGRKKWQVPDPSKLNNGFGEHCAADGLVSATDAGADKTFFDKVNEAFPDIRAWAPKVFPNEDTTYWINSRGETAIEIVIANGGAADAMAAALLLCKSCGIDPKALGYIPPPGGTGSPPGTGGGTPGAGGGRAPPLYRLSGTGRCRSWRISPPRC